MWAGSSLRFHDRLRVGDAVERVSRITDISIKKGRSGTLCFVSVSHEIATARGLAITDDATIVYRNLAGKPVSARAQGPTAASSTLSGGGRWQRAVRTDPVLLFRYSALTFNGHRIHYDRDYAVKGEGFAGLVVHGPLQASWLLEHAAAILRSAPTTFKFIARLPLFEGAVARVCAADAVDGLHLWIQDSEGHRFSEAEAQR
jgi:3-methylfumaryl-CoA hydratase